MTTEKTPAFYPWELFTIAKSVLDTLVRESCNGFQKMVFKNGF